MKNKEGYPDPTAAQAIASIRRGEKYAEKRRRIAMNRAQRRKLIQMPKGKPKHNTASAAASNAQTGVTAQNAQGIIDNLPLPQLVAGINNLLKQLEQRGVPIYDWDDNGRTLYRLQMRRGKVFYLAAEKAPEPEAENPEKE